MTEVCVEAVYKIRKYCEEDVEVAMTPLCDADSLIFKLFLLFINPERKVMLYCDKW